MARKKEPSRSEPVTAANVEDPEATGWTYEFAEFKPKGPVQASTEQAPPGTVVHTRHGIRVVPDAEPARIVRDAKGAVYPVPESIFNELFKS